MRQKILMPLVRRLLRPESRFALRRMASDARPSAAFALNLTRQRQARRELARCRSVQDVLEFTRRRLGVGAVQNPSEITATLAHLEAQAPRRVCEIGTEHGGTNLLLSQALKEARLVIGIDLYIKHWPHLRLLKKRGLDLHLLFGSSRTPRMVGRVEKILAGEKLDVLFIDGDHSYDGVKSDFLLYRHLVRDGGSILFHDIVPDHGARFGASSGAWAGGVPLLWERLKLLYPHHEFVHDGAQDGMGIGVLLYSSHVDLPEDLVHSHDDPSAYPLMHRSSTC